MALIIPVAGASTSTYSPGSSASGGAGAASQGIMTDDGYRLRWNIHKQRIGNDGTDQYGQTLLESIYRGADWSIIYRCREYAAGNVNAAWPYGKGAGGGANGVLAPTMGTIGRADDTNSLTGVLILTAVSGTTAASNPATLTASKAIMADSQESALEFTSKLREVPVMLVLYPYVSTYTSTPICWFQTS